MATVSIFLPCTALMLFLSSRYERLRNMELVKAALDGIIPAVVGLVAAAAYGLGATSLVQVRDFVLLASRVRHSSVYLRQSHVRHSRSRGNRVSLRFRLTAVRGPIGRRCQKGVRP